MQYNHTFDNGDYTDDHGDKFNQYGDLIEEYQTVYGLDDDDKVLILESDRALPDYTAILQSKIDSGMLSISQAKREYTRLSENFIQGSKFEQHLINQEIADNQTQKYNCRSRNVDQLVDNREHALPTNEREYLEDTGKPRPKIGTFGFKKKHSTRKINNQYHIADAKIVNGKRQRVNEPHNRKYRYNKRITKQRHLDGQFDIDFDHRSKQTLVSMNHSELELLQNYFKSLHNTDKTLSIYQIVQTLLVDIEIKAAKEHFNL